jgi:molecular chaperone HscC
MAKLKTHPREEQANRFLLQRAERLFEELPRDEREMLGQMLDGFEGALAMQDPAVIARHREALEEFLDMHDASADGGGDDDEDIPF